MKDFFFLNYILFTLHHWDHWVIPLDKRRIAKTHPLASAFIMKRKYINTHNEKSDHLLTSWCFLFTFWHSLLNIIKRPCANRWSAWTESNTKTTSIVTEPAFYMCYAWRFRSVETIDSRVGKNYPVEYQTDRLITHKAQLWKHKTYLIFGVAGKGFQRKRRVIAMHHQGRLQ